MQASLIIIRGLPGSGKSTLAKLLSEEGRWPVFSFDDYFTDEEGKYAFRYEDNHLAYLQCKEQCEEAMKNKVEKIFLDNVFSMEWEMDPYFKLAAEYGYKVHVLTAENRHQGVNIHSISSDMLDKIRAGFKVRL